MKFQTACRQSLLLLPVIAGLWANAQAANTQGVDAIKNYLVTQVSKMDAASHDYATNAAAYDAIIKANGGDYNQAAIHNGPQLLTLVAKMQADYKNIHMNGYETVEGIAAGVKELVKYDIYFDSGVPSDEATTDNPSAPIVLKTASGEMIDDHQGNLFHYVIEQALWGANAELVKRLSPAATQQLHGIILLPRADVLVASSRDCAEKADQFLADSKAWQPTLDECVGALVWMTPTFNTYYDDLKDSLYNPSGKYISESRVLDMRGIMGSLQLVYNAIRPQLEQKDPALAAQLKNEYDGIMRHVDETDRRDKAARAASKKLSKVEIEEMAEQAKHMSDQLAPQLEQVAAILGLKLPPKPFLA
jgi:CheY-like chemotaxis protein